MVQLTKRQENKLDSQINTLYTKLAHGRQIDIMKIGVLFRYVKQSHVETGTNLETAIKSGIEIYCLPKSDS